MQPVARRRRLAGAPDRFDHGRRIRLRGPGAPPGWRAACRPRRARPRRTAARRCCSSSARCRRGRCCGRRRSASVRPPRRSGTASRARPVPAPSGVVARRHGHAFRRPLNVPCHCSSAASEQTILVQTARRRRLCRAQTRVRARLAFRSGNSRFIGVFCISACRNPLPVAFRWQPPLCFFYSANMRLGLHLATRRSTSAPQWHANQHPNNEQQLPLQRPTP